MFIILLFLLVRESICQLTSTTTQATVYQPYRGPGYQNQQNQQLGYQNQQSGYQNQGSHYQSPQYQPQDPNVPYNPNPYSAAGNPQDQQSIYDDFGPTVPPSDPNFVVMNPNVRFLPQNVYEQYVNSYNSGQRLRDSGGYIPPTTTQPPILSNQQQNQDNWQQIQNQPPSSTPLYTNNIYGYDYRSNPDQPYTYDGNPQQYQPPAFTRFQPPPGSPYGRKKRQVDESNYGDSEQDYLPVYNLNYTSKNGDPKNLSMVVYAFVEDAQPWGVQDQSSNEVYDDSYEDSSFRSQNSTSDASDFQETHTRKKRLNGIGTFTHQEPMYDPRAQARWNSGLGGQVQSQPSSNQAFYNPSSNSGTGFQYNPSGSSGIQPYTGTNIYYPYRTDVDSPSGPPTANYYQYSLAGPTAGNSYQYNPPNTISGSGTSAQAYNAPQYNYPDPSVYRGAPVINPNSPNYQQAIQQNQQVLNDYQDPNCSGQDPYWCAQYVNEFLGGLTQYDNTPQPAACQQLVSSLQFSDNRCCQAVRSSGCQS